MNNDKNRDPTASRMPSKVQYLLLIQFLLMLAPTNKQDAVLPNTEQDVDSKVVHSDITNAVHNSLYAVRDNKCRNNISQPHSSCCLLVCSSEFRINYLHDASTHMSQDDTCMVVRGTGYPASNTIGCINICCHRIKDLHFTCTSHLLLY